MRRILHIIGSLNRGGAEAFLMNLYRNWNRNEIQFDFALYDHEKDKNFYYEAKKLGAEIYYLPYKSKGIIRNLKAIKSLVEEKKYTVVWRHTDSYFGALDLLGAKMGGAKHLILHSHNTKTTKVKSILQPFLKPLINMILTDRFACGVEAGKWMYGNRKYEVINNGIDIEKYNYNELVRKEYREKFNVEDKIVLGHVGRFNKIKNQEFLLQIVKKMIEKKDNVILILVGDGELKNRVEHRAIEIGISEYVQFLGVRDDIECLMQMFDVFVMPSLFEGFPVVLVEAQTAALPCVVSTNISREVKISDYFQFIDLTKTPAEWRENIIEMAKKVRVNRSQQMRKAGYDIKNTAELLQNKFSK